MQRNSLERLERRIAHASQPDGDDFLSFGGERQMSWGYETERGPDYNWNGLKRGISPNQPRVLFQFTLRGRGEYTEKSQYWALKAGDSFTVILPSAHRYFMPPGSGSWTFFWFMVQHPFATERMREMRRSEAAVQRWAADSNSLNAAVALFEAAALGHLADIWSFEERLFTWVLETERELHHRRYPQGEQEQLLQEMRRMVLPRLEDPPGITELAQAHGMERTTFSRKFKARTGLAPAACLTKIRLEEALKLLRTEAHLKEIAARTGFADANHFCKVFRRNYHLSPGAYRRLMLKKNRELRGISLG